MMRFLSMLLTSTALTAVGAAPGAAGDAPAILGGAASIIGGVTSQLPLNQSSPRAIINSTTFNIGAGETTTFMQPGSSSVAPTGVIGGVAPSQIYGTPNATAGFLASTNIKNANVMAGRSNFNIPGRLDVSIVNQGTITAMSGGFAALVAPGVRNSGTITATLGTVAVAPGNTFTLDLYGDKLIQLAPSDAIANKVIDVATGKPLASLSANGGRVELTAAGARAVVDSVINTKGVIEANSVGLRDGKIVLGAATAKSKPQGVGNLTTTNVPILTTAGSSGGPGDIVSGLVSVNVAVGLNAGTINQTLALGAVAGGDTAFISGFTGANIGILGSELSGSITQSYALGLDTAHLIGGLSPSLNTTIWVQAAGYPLLANLGLQGTTLGLQPLLSQLLPPELTQVLTPLTPLLSQLLPPELTQLLPPLPPLVSQLLPPELTQLVNNPSSPPPPPPLINLDSIIQQPGDPINDPTRLNVGEGRYFYLPPSQETRLLPDEVVIQLPCNAAQQTLTAALRQLQLTVLNSQCLSSMNVAVYRLRIGNRRALADVIRGLANHRLITAAQANYRHVLGTDQMTEHRGDAGQYVLEKLRLIDIHRQLRATNVPVAVIDSEIDATHPELNGTVISRFDVTGVEAKPHSHGTGMAGAIASHRRLLGIAPGARLFAIRAFSIKADTAESTTFNILKGLDHAMSNGVRIVNMSFAGPRDPSLERAFKDAHGQGVVLIAAAGNAGPRSPPLFPAASPHVIAVTATDIDDKLFAGATRGKHVAVAAPGVDILLPAPAGAYQMASGTSVATAHVSGVVALMLEHNPRLTPAAVRRILTASAKRLGPNDQFGAGLIDPVEALLLAAPRSVEAAALPPR